MKPTRTQLKVLLVEDSEADADLLEHELRRAGYEASYCRVDTADALKRVLPTESWDIIISDWAMGPFDGEKALHIARELNPDIPFVVVSGTIGEEKAVSLMRQGARDFVLKGRLGRLPPVIDRELAEREQRKIRRETEEALLRTEEQLRQSQKMEAIGRLAGGVAHDFNNLLSVILSYVSMALGDLAADDPLRADLREVQEAAERASSLTRQLLSFSRRQIIQPKKINVNETLSRMEKMLRRLIGEDVELDIRLPREVARVRVDPGQFEQVVMNLVVNARDAMPNGGRLTIDAGRADGDQLVRLAVADTGTGMSKETQSKIFEPFFTTKELGHGTGLGLSTVMSIVKQSGGNVNVASAPGLGTTFTVHFKAAAEHEEGDEEEVATPLTGAALRGDETVLLVEDDPSLRALTRVILQRNGYEVLEAQGAGDALLLCEQHPGPIHLLLTDVVMPRMSGRALAERAIPMRPTMAVLYMSGYTDEAVLRLGVAGTQTAFLQKPITPDTIARKVRDTLDRSRN